MISFGDRRATRRAAIWHHTRASVALHRRGCRLPEAGARDQAASAAPTARAAMTTFALNLARTFTESEDFKRRYADHREANGPEPLPEEQTADTIFKKQRDGFEKVIASIERAYMARVRMPSAAANARFDEITNHGLNAIGEDEALALVLKATAVP